MMADHTQVAQEPRAMGQDHRDALLSGGRTWTIG